MKYIKIIFLLYIFILGSFQDTQHGIDPVDHLKSSVKIYNTKGGWVSGFVIDNEYVISTYHLFDNVSEKKHARVEFQDGSIDSMVIIKFDKNKDLFLGKLKSKRKYSISSIFLKQATKKFRAGDSVIVYGSPGYGSFIKAEGVYIKDTVFKNKPYQFNSMFFNISQPTNGFCGSLVVNLQRTSFGIWVRGYKKILLSKKDSTKKNKKWKETYQFKKHMITSKEVISFLEYRNSP